VDLILVLRRHPIISVIHIETGRIEHLKNMERKGTQDLKKLNDFGKISERAKFIDIKNADPNVTQPA
jgi:hypothetical protein